MLFFSYMKKECLNRVSSVPSVVLNPYPGFEGIRSSLEFMAKMGLPKSDLKEILGRGEKKEPEEARVNGFFLGEINTIFDLKLHNVDEIQSFFLSQLKKANDTVRIIGNTLGLPPTVYSLHNEVDVVDPSIARMLSLLDRDRVDPVLRFEVQRQLALAYLSAGINTRTMHDRAYDVLSALQEGLNSQFFIGKIGHYETEVITSLHDPETNRTLGVYHQGEAVPVRDFAGTLIKNTPMSFRTISIGSHEIKVLYGVRKKSDEAAIIKAINKGISRGRSIDVFNDVLDSLGLMFVVDGGEEERRLVAQHFFQFLNRYNEKLVRLDDSRSGNDRGQSDLIHFERYQIISPDISLPLETMFFSLPDYINSQSDIGRRGNDGIYDGAAHSLYELRRSRQVAQRLFPKEMYPQINIGEYARKKSNNIAIELKRKTFV